MFSKKKLLAIILSAGMLLNVGCGQIDSKENKDSSNTVATNSSEVKSSAVPTAVVPATPVPTKGTFQPDQGYSDSNCEVSILGLKEYKTIKTKKFTDKAGKGKKYLVLFLKVRNRTDSTIYFNVNYLKATLDGKKIENTFLLNKPENYPTIFSNIVADSYYGGFIVWKVPENWKKLDITYDGWKASDGLSLSAELGKKDLSKPEKYDSYAYEENLADE